MATNPSVERARLFSFLSAENPITLPIFVEVTGEIQIIAAGPNAGDRQVVNLKPRRTYELLNFAPIEWWKQAASTNDLINAINNSWISVPLASDVVPAPVILPSPEEEDHFLIKWHTTAAPQLSAATEARMYFSGQKVLLSENGGAYAPVVTLSAVATLTYAASVSLDFDPALPEHRTLSLTGNVTFTTANLGPGRKVTTKIDSDGSVRTFTFPAGWTFMGAVPANIAANKTAVLSLVSYGALESVVVAIYSVEP